MDREQYTDPERREGHEEPETQQRENQRAARGNANSQVGQGTSISEDFAVPVPTDATQSFTDAGMNDPEDLGLSRPGATTMDGDPGTGFYGTADERPGEEGVEEPSDE